MKITVCDTPWKHWIIDDFLDENLFYLIKETLTDFPKAEENNRIHFFFDDHGCKTIHEKLRDRYLEFTNTLGEDFARKTIKTEYLNVGKGFSYPTHRDAVCKIFTVVLYISDFGSGTKIFSSETDFYKEVEWKPNRALGFYRSDDSWHSYYSNENDRTTINIFSQ